MTVPPGMPPLPDPRRILAGLTADVRAFEARAARTQEALAAASAEVEADHLTLRMLGAHITGITFTEQALGLSPARLAEELRRAVARGAAATNRASADAVRRAFGDEAAARGIAEAAPEEDRDDAARPAATGGENDGGGAGEPAYLDPMTPQEQQELIDELLADDSVDDEPDDLAELARQLDYHPSPGAPEDQQAILEAQLQRLNANAAALPALMTSIEGTADSEAVEITVNAAGALVSARFHAAFARRGAEELGDAFLATYERARADAGGRLAEGLRESGFATGAATLRDLGL